MYLYILIFYNLKILDNATRVFLSSVNQLGQRNYVYYYYYYLYERCCNGKITFYYV